MELNIYKHKILGHYVGLITSIHLHPEADQLELHRTIKADTITYINGTDEADQVSDLFLKYRADNQIQKLNVYQTSYVQITNVYKVGADITTLWKLDGNVQEQIKE